MYECAYLSQLEYMNGYEQMFYIWEMLLYSQFFWVGGIYIDGFASNDQYLYAINFLCLYQVRVITVFTVFRLLTDFVCLHNYEFWLSLCKIVRSSVIWLLPLFSTYIYLFQKICPRLALLISLVSCPSVY